MKGYTLIAYKTEGPVEGIKELQKHLPSDAVGEAVAMYFDEKDMATRNSGQLGESLRELIELVEERIEINGNDKTEKGS